VPRLDPLRGEIWDAQFPGIGAHPVVVLTISPMVPKLGAVTVVLVTGTEGPPSTHIPLDSDSGLTGYDVSFANATELHTLPKGKLRNQLGHLSLVALDSLEEAVRTYLGL
jgi:mRNA interferase MazF